MPIRLLLCVLRSRWFGTPALIVLLASGCELAEPVAPPTGDLSALEHPAGLGHFTIEVDPRAGFVDLRAPALDMERAGSSSASVPAGGPGYALIPATEDLLRTSVTCEGCNDRILDNQIITVRFTVGDVVLEGIDFRRNEDGEAIPVMTCTNCGLSSAVLLPVAPSTLPAELQPGDMFEVVLAVEALELGTFGIRFELTTAAATLPLTLVEETLTPGDGHTCGLTAEGRAYCWGSNQVGQLGDGTTSQRSVPTPVAGGYTFTVLAAGGRSTFGITTDGQTLAWGSNENGQLGDGTTTNRLVPTPVLGNHTFRSLSAGWRYVIGLTSDGQAFAWGDNSFGQLGDGTNTDRHEPTPLAGNHTFRSVSAGSQHSLGLTPAGQALAWGFNHEGQLGDGTTVNRWIPTPVVGGHVFLSISAGRQHSIALTPSGKAWAWGWNEYGQIGSARCCNESNAPRLVAGNHTFRSVSAGYGYSLGVTSEGRALAWGWNHRGQLGDGTRTNRRVPTPVAGNHTFHSLHAGFAPHTVGLTTTGQVFAWGYNPEGNVGDGTTMMDRLVPTLVVGNLKWR